MSIVIVAGVLAIAFLATGRVTPEAAWRSIDVDLLLVLFALLIAVEILRGSGWLDFAVEKTVARFHRARSFAAMMLVVTGILSMLVTNDIALFVVIPFTVAASRMSGFDVEDIVILEVIAANLLGCLTPIGNPQNLFIYHRSHWSAGRFALTMLPFFGICIAGLAIAVALLRGGTLTNTEPELPPRNSRAAAAGAITFLLVLLEIARVVSGWPAAIAALVSAALFLRRRMDLSIVPLFFFAFIVVDGLRTFPLRLFDTYWSSIALSQVISNVPAALLLTPFAHGDWRELLYGVNAGGCGTIIASLANLLGWRIYRREAGSDSRFVLRLTWINVAFLGWVGIGGRILLSALG